MEYIPFIARRRFGQFVPRPPVDPMARPNGRPALGLRNTQPLPPYLQEESQLQIQQAASVLTSAATVLLQGGAEEALGGSLDPLPAPQVCLMYLNTKCVHVCVCVYTSHRPAEKSSTSRTKFGLWTYIYTSCRLPYHAPVRRYIHTKCKVQLFSRSSGWLVVALVCCG